MAKQPLKIMVDLEQYRGLVEIAHRRTLAAGRRVTIGQVVREAIDAYDHDPGGSGAVHDGIDLLAQPLAPLRIGLRHEIPKAPALRKPPGPSQVSPDGVVDQLADGLPRQGGLFFQFPVSRFIKIPDGNIHGTPSPRPASATDPHPPTSCLLRRDETTGKARPFM